MKNISVRLATGMLLISVLGLASGIALGQTYTDTGNATTNGTAAVNTTVAVTGNMTTYQVQNTAVSDTTVQVTSTPAETDVSTPAETATPTETETFTPLPTPTPKSPGFESIIAIAGIIAAICLINIRRR